MFQDFFKNDKVSCIDRENGILNRYEGSTNRTVKPFQLAFLPCQDDSCKSQEESEAWFNENRPRLLVLGTKRLFDFQAKEDYMYEQMVPLVLSCSITSGTGVKIMEKVVLTLSAITMKDALFNPFNSVTFEMEYADVQQLDHSAMQQTEIQEAPKVPNDS